MFQRYVALGDSFSEGVGDPDPSRPNGLRGWTDRVAESLAALDPGFGYANLAIRGRKLGPILDEQLAPALALGPDLVTLQGGGNDLMRPKVDIDGLIGALHRAVARFTALGARVVLPTYADGGTRGPLRGRFIRFHALLVDLADRHGAVLVDNWVPRMQDPRLWDADWIHLAAAGHERVAARVLESLGVAAAEPSPLPDVPALTVWAKRRRQVHWMGTQAVPWVHRRLTGRSSGDGVSPKRPELAPISPAAPRS